MQRSLDDRVVEIATLASINGFPFGAPASDLVELAGPPDEALTNYTGEFETLYGDCFYRFYADRFVEFTAPDTYRFRVDDIDVLSIFDWLGAQPDRVDRARFRISRAHGIAYDYRDPEHGSITVFEAGRWDTLLEG